MIFRSAYGSRWWLILNLALMGCAACCSASEGSQFGTLAAAESPRFELTGRVWPTEIRKPHVCLWKDDTLAAVSITIDDNTAPDQDWWIEQGRTHGIRATWFVITSLVNDERPGYHGSWDAFRRLHREGHDIQSHTITHVSLQRGFDPNDTARNLDVEYGRSRDIIQEHIPGQRVMTLAFPGGLYQREHTDPELAAKYYIAARGGAGHINPANWINYQQTYSIGNGLHVDDPQHVRTRLSNLVDREKAYRPAQYRGWYVAHFHRVADADKPRLVEAFAWLLERQADVWTGLFREVAQYGQQRDTARLAVTSADTKTIQLSLTDNMDDQLFDFPLTVKLRLPNAWKDFSATQGGTAISAQIVDHDGVRFAVVQAVPDRGEVILRSATPTAIRKEGAEP